MQKRIVNIIVILLLVLIAIIPMIVDANHSRFSSPFTNPRNTIKTISNENYDMVVIAPSCYSSVLQPFIEHKNNREIITKFVSINDIYNGTYFEVQGRDNQEKIKYFIKDAIENWGITYVLFVGNYKQVPVRYCYNNDNFSGLQEKFFISELYYADIYNDTGDFSNWDSDGDGIYGEWYSDVAEDRPINLTPDICLGRLACSNKNEVKTVVKKIINYEKQPVDISWFKRMVVVGGDTYQQFEGYEGEIINQRAIDVMEGFTPIKLWVSNGKLTKKGWSIVREINKGCGFWYLSGHGSNRLWLTHASDKSIVGLFYSLNMLFLFNKNKLPICLVEGCLNSNFTSEPFCFLKAWDFITWSKECWSWQLVSKSNGGSIATIGCTGLCWYGVEYGGGGADWLNLQFFKEYKNGTVILGKIWKNALTRYIENFPIDWETPFGGVSSIDAKTVQEWTLLGNPSLTIWGDNYV